MQNEYVVSIYLDTRRMKSNGMFPLKLKIYIPATQKRKYFPTKYDFTIKEFASIWQTKKPRKEHKYLRRELMAFENAADEIAESIFPFSFEQFEKRYYRKKGDEKKINYNYNKKIQELSSMEQISTANTYSLSQKSISDFVEQGMNKDYQNLTFFDVNPQWLQSYEDYMTKVLGRSRTTVSIYVRCLRTLFNDAISDKEIDKNIYPFGKKKYVVPSSKKTKRALNKSQLALLFNADPKSPEQEVAKDFWFFSYSCNGINIKDISLLKYNNIEDDRIVFYRAKTIISTKASLEPITVYLNDFSRKVITKYGRKENNPEGLIFKIIESNWDPLEKHKGIKKFTRFINQHIKKLCCLNELPFDISTYWARHSFASNLSADGATIDEIRKSLGHKNIRVTQDYLNSFDDERMKKLTNSLMDFEKD